MNKDTIDKDTMNKDTMNKDTMNKGTMNKGTTPSLSLVLVLMHSACRTDESSIKAYNALPSISIQSHTDGAIVLDGLPETFYALATDSNHTADELQVAWFYGEDLVCSWVAPDEGGGSTCEITPNQQEFIVRAEVRDPENAGALNEVSLTIQPSYPPEISLLTPNDGDVFSADDNIQFSAIVSDAEDAPTDLNIQWSSNIDGTLSLDNTVDSSGEMSDFTTLTPGEHVIQLEVEDTMGKTTTEEVQILVNEVNQAPLCEILEPNDGSSGLLGTNVLFRGSVSDADHDLDDLSIEWLSDKDGTLGTSIADSTGLIALNTSSLSSNSHVITLRVEDPEGDVCTSNVLYSVGSPPSVTLYEPGAGTVYNLGTSVYFEALVQDGEDPANLLQVEWSSDIDGTFSNSTANSSGLSALNYSQLSAGVHNITVQVTDSDALYDTAITNLRINTPPTAPQVQFSPSVVGTNDNILVQSSGSIDVDGDPINYLYDWRLNGVSIGQTSALLPSSNTSKNEVWTIRVTPNDGFADGLYTDATITIANTAPVISSVVISPANASTQDTLTCTQTSTDPDGDSLSESFAWRINGNLSSSTGNTLSGPFVSGDSIVCEATVADGTDVSTLSSNPLGINNGAPVITGLVLSPLTPATNDLLEATVQASDPDGDPLTYTWDWTVDDGTGASVVQSTNSSTSTDTLDGVVHFERDDLIQVTVTVNDGSGSTVLPSSTLTVINTPPTVFNPLIIPVAPVAGLDDLECTVQSSDADLDSISLQFSWTLNGSGTNYSTAVIPTSDIANGDIWVCSISCDDGIDVGNSTTATTTVGSNAGDAVGGNLCASAGEGINSQYSLIGCLGDVGVSSGESSNASYTLQSGTHYIYTPE